MASVRYKALYTKHLTKKIKSWQDGILIQQGQQLVLKDEDGSTLASVPCPANLHLHADYDEAITCLDGLLVRLDGLSDSSAGAEPVPVQQAVLKRPSTWPASSSRPFKTKPTGRSSFAVPRPAQAAATMALGINNNHSAALPDTQRGQKQASSTLQQHRHHEHHQQEHKQHNNPCHGLNAMTSSWLEPQHQGSKPAGPAGPTQTADTGLLAWLGVPSSLLPAQQNSSHGNCTQAKGCHAVMTRPGLEGIDSQQQHGQQQPWQQKQGHQQQVQHVTCMQQEQGSWQPLVSSHKQGWQQSELQQEEHHQPMIADKWQEWHDKQQQQLQLQAVTWQVADNSLLQDTAAPAGVIGADYRAEAWHTEQHSRQPSKQPDQSIVQPATRQAAGSSASGWQVGAAASELHAKLDSHKLGQGVDTIPADASTDLACSASNDRVPHIAGGAGTRAFKTPAAVSSLVVRSDAPAGIGLGAASIQTVDNLYAGIVTPSISSSSHSVAGAATVNAALRRVVAIPTQFSDVSQYLKVMTAAVVEEVNLRVAAAAQPLLNHMQAVQSQLCGPPIRTAQQGQHTKQTGSSIPRSAQGAGHAAARSCSEAKSMSATALPETAVAAALEHACMRTHVPYFATAQLSVYQPFNFKQGGQNGRRSKSWKSGKGKKQAPDDEDYDDASSREHQLGSAGSAMQAACRYFLVIPQARARIKDFRRHDLWFLSSSPMLQSGNKPTAPHLLLVVRSLWHAPDRDGKMEVELLASLTSTHPARNQSVYAWRWPDVQTELQLLSLLQSVTPSLCRAAATLHQGRQHDPASQSALCLLPHLLRLHLDWPRQHQQEQSTGVEGQQVHQHHYSMWQVCQAQSMQGSATNATAVRAFKAHKPKAVKKKTPKHDTAAADEALDANGHAANSDATDGEEHEDGDGSDKHSIQPPQSVAELVAHLILQYRLNEDQQRVLQHVASWLGQHEAAQQQQALAALQHVGCGAQPAYQAVQAPVCLIHGPFGSGKSTLLAAVITLLVFARELPGQTAATAAACRVLVAAHTNVAVDRVLLALQERGFSSFLRVGSLPRIARAILPHSLHAADDSKDAKAQLSAMLAAETDDHERALLQRELTALQQGAERKRKKALRSSPVVGTTCCALLQSELWASAGHFPVVVLDECSQMTEPTSLIPICKLKPSFLIAAGDPMQLPPVIANPALLHQADTAGPSQHNTSQHNKAQHSGTTLMAMPHGQQQHGLLRPLFVRLQHLGYPVHLLRTQYRCHPSISHIPNKHFYGGQLINGCSTESRAAVPGAPHLPALSVCEVVGGQTAMDTRTRSSYNQAEAHGICQVAHALLDAGVPASDIGIIAFYKAQVATIQQMMQGRTAGAQQQQPDQQQQQQQPVAGLPSNGTRGVQVATVDSFQGAEKEVVLLATTVTRRSDFVADAARLNVTLTRAKRHLVVFGCSHVLSATAPAFAAIIGACKSSRAAAPSSTCKGDVHGGEGHMSCQYYPNVAHLLRLLGGHIQEGAPAEATANQQPCSMDAVHQECSRTVHTWVQGRAMHAGYFEDQPATMHAGCAQQQVQQHDSMQQVQAPELKGNGSSMPAPFAVQVRKPSPGQPAALQSWPQHSLQQQRQQTRNYWSYGCEDDSEEREHQDDHCRHSAPDCPAASKHMHVAGQQAECSSVTAGVVVQASVLKDQYDVGDDDDPWVHDEDDEVMDADAPRFTFI